MNRREFLSNFSVSAAPQPPTRARLRDSADYETSNNRRVPPLYEVERGSGGEVVPTAGSPRQYKRGDLVLVLDAHAWLGCDEIGFYAIDALCPHLGCFVKRSGGLFVCPGHGSRFDLDGARENGPAHTNLRYLLVDLDDQNHLVIRRDKLTTPTDRFIA